jgi:hypothetical protein
MKGARSRFLMLTGALSAAMALALGATSGCNTLSTKTRTSPTSDSGTTTDGAAGDASADASDSGVVPCLNDNTNKGDVDAGDAGLDCLSNADGTCQSSCQNVLTILKAGVAYEAAECILKLPSCEGAATDVIGDCVIDAGAKACADPTSAAFCSSIQGACTDAGADPDAGDGGTALTQADCVKIANTLSETGREAFTSCMIDNGGCVDPTVCIAQARH